MSIALQMREASASDHRAAESMHFIKHLMEGQLSKADYVAYLNQLAYVYQALERKLPVAAPLPYSPALCRFDSILEDLERLEVEDFTQTAMLPATAAYVDRLSELGGVEDVRLVAHHYTRYLGDLSGGQAIGALVQRHYGLSPAQTTFYKFPEIENIVRFKEQYRESLDALAINDLELQLLLDEVKIAFKLNQALFADLALVQIAA
jgi:heme oxygenase